MGHAGALDEGTGASCRVEPNFPEPLARPGRLGLAALLLAASPALGAVSTPEKPALLAVEPILVEPAATDGGASEALVPALLSRPPGWAAGDAAVVLAAAEAPTDRRRQRLAERLLRAGLAVLELDADPAAPALPTLFGAMRSLREQAEAGPVLLLATGAAGGPALRAVDEAAEVRHLPSGAPGFAAALALGPNSLLAAPGAAAPSGMAWEAAARRLCAALDRGEAAGGTLAAPAGRRGAMPPPRRIESTCLGALVAGGAGAAESRAAPGLSALPLAAAR